MKVVSSVVMMALALTLGSTSFASKALAPKETREMKRDSEKGKGAPGVPAQKTGSGTNADVLAESAAIEGTRGCRGECVTTELVADMVSNPAGKDLDAKGASNMREAALRAKELRKTGLPAEEATDAALREQGIDPKEIDEACAR